MKKNPSKEGVLTASSTLAVTVTRKKLRERAVELAIISGRTSLEVLKSDWDQARHEFTGWPDSGVDDSVEAVRESWRC